MRISDVVNQIRRVMPKYTDLMSAQVSITSIVASGGVATVTTSGFNSLNGSESLTIAATEHETGIDSVSQDGLTFTFGTAIDHDLTEGYQDSVTFTGFTDNDWNASFKLLSVPNRQLFKVQSVNSIPVLNGAEELIEPRNDGVNGRFDPTVISSNTFSISGSFIDGTYVGGTVSGEVRVMGMVTVEQLIGFYTERCGEEVWLFVIPKDADISKDRDTQSDAVSTQVTGDAMRTRLVDGFLVYGVIPTTNELSGIDALDTMRHDLLLPMLKTIYGTRFDSGLSGGDDFKTVLVGHRVFDYSGAVLVYEYDFETVYDLTAEDQVENEDNMAFRDIDSTQTIGTQDMTVNVDLDEEPLP